MKSIRIINALILVAISSILNLGTLIQSSRAVSHSTTTARETKTTSSLKWTGPVSGPEQIIHRIRRGDTLGKILSPYKLPRQETQLWFRSIAKKYSLKKLRPGRKIYLYLSQRNYHSAEEIDNWHLKALAIELNKDQILTWERGNKGVVFYKRELPYEKEIKTSAVRITSSSKWTGSVDGSERIIHRIRRGDTLGKILSPYKLPRQETQLWFRSIAKKYSLKKLRPGRKIYLYLSQRNYHSAEEIDNWHLKALAIELNKDQILTWERGNKGVVFYKRELPYEKEIKTSAVRITSSLYKDGRRAGLPPALISKFVDIFAWEIDFQTELQKGAFFKVLYERSFRAGLPKKEKFRILAAELTNRKRKYHALYFKQRNGSANYYDLKGASLARSFLRYPVGFSRISSTFSHRRYHPILKVRRPHRGVDFVAKRGTPVRAVGSGRITYAGWKKGGYGRFIEIQHGSVFKTRYAHLHRIVRGLRRGKIIKKGQVIGTVGCSGRCTGPHLHFEMYKTGKYVNPLKFAMPREEKINPDLQKLFDKTKQLFLAQLVGIPRS